MGGDMKVNGGGLNGGGLNGGGLNGGGLEGAKKATTGLTPTRSPMEQSNIVPSRTPGLTPPVGGEVGGGGIEQILQILVQLLMSVLGGNVESSPTKQPPALGEPALGSLNGGGKDTGKDVAKIAPSTGKLTGGGSSY